MLPNEWQNKISGALAERLAPLGMSVLGWFAVLPLECSDSELAGYGPAVLIGNKGGAMWPVFAASAEFRDSKPDPMDRWTRRVLGEIAMELVPQARQLFPFGETVWPFQRWAGRAMGVSQSPLGLLVHREYGLWFALRAALVFPQSDAAGEKVIQRVDELNHPCLECDEKPCLNACPVTAFSKSGFAVNACRSYLDSIQSSQTDSSLTAMPNCMDKGCAARNACPVGREWRYGEAQLQFHLQAFKR